MFDEYPDAAGFLRAIREAPDDPTHRLVFADWLDERGDLRAAWLRDADLWSWMSPDCHDPVSGLLDACGDHTLDYPIRERAREALRRLGPPAVEQIRAWTRQQEDRWWETRSVLETTPPPMLPPVQELVARLSDPSWVEAWLALADLAFHGPAAASAVPALVAFRHDEFFEGDSDPVQEATCRALGAIGPAAVEAIPRLFETLDYRGDRADAAADALCKIGRHDPDRLLACAYVGDHDGCGDRPLRVLVDAHPEGLAVLARVLRREPDMYQGPVTAAKLIGERAAEAGPLVPVLVQTLQRTADEAERAALASALGKTGEQARVAVPVLLALFGAYAGQPLEQRDPASWAGLEIAAALARLGEPAVGLPHLRVGLTASLGYFRHRCVELLTEVAAVVPDALDELLAATDDPEEWIRSKAVWSLAPLMTDRVEIDRVLPVLLDALVSPSGSLRSAAASCLGRLRAAHNLDGSDPRDQAILAALLAAVDDAEFQVHSAALSALGAARLPGSMAGPLLAVLAQDRDSATNELAVRALGQVSELSAECVPAAEALRGHPVLLVREAVTRLLGEGPSRR